MEGKTLVLQLGFSHPIRFEPPAGITHQGREPDAARGQRAPTSGWWARSAADIRGFRPPEPYKGKGVKYEGEYIRRKAGKAAGSRRHERTPQSSTSGAASGAIAFASACVGSAERPRLSVFRSSSTSTPRSSTTCGGVTLGCGLEPRGSGGAASRARARPRSATAVGKLVAERAKEKGVDKVCFDRGGYLYHGRVKALADGARAGGLNF